MRFSGFVGLVTLGLGLACTAGCEDAKSPSVQAEIGWKVGCAAGSTGCTQFRFHAQDTATYERDFKVSCSISGDSISFTLTDPGVDLAKMPMGGWPGSTISVTNGNAATSACNVTVTDSMEYGQAAITMRGHCASSGGLGGCTLQRMPDSSGWDWVGTLSCDKMERDSMPTPQYKLNGRDGTSPISLAFANCD